MPSGFHKLDAMTAGLQPGDLIIVAARPSMGKTSLVMNAAQNAAIEYKVPALVLLARNVEGVAGRAPPVQRGARRLERLRGGFLEQRDWINITKAASRIAEAPIYIDDSGAPTLLEIRAKAVAGAPTRTSSRPRRDQLGMIVIDYLQLIHGRPQGKEQNREREISEISRGLKALAKELQRADHRALAAQPRRRVARRQAAACCRTSASRAPSSRTPT